MDQPASIYASERIATLASVPSPKAWSREDDGTLVILGSTRLTKEPDGSISIVSASGGTCELPLIAKAENFESLLSLHLRVHGGIPTGFEPAHYRDAFRAYVERGEMDRRLAPRTRRAIEEAADHFQTAGEHARDRDRLYRESERWALSDIAGHEYNSFWRRIKTRAFGYSRGATSVAKLVNAVLWEDVYDRDVARATILAYGHKATTANYSTIARSWSRIDAQGREVGLKSLVATHRPAIQLMTALIPQHLRLRRLDGADGVVSISDFAAQSRTDVCDAVRDARETLVLAGLRPSVWRMLLRMSAPQIVALRTLLVHALGEEIDEADTDPFGFVEVAYADAERPTPRDRQTSIDALNRLAELGAETAPFTFLLQIARLAAPQRAAMLPHLKAVLEGGRAARRRGAVKDEADRIGLIGDAMLSLAADGDPRATRSNLGWGTLDAIQTEWHGQFEGGHGTALLDPTAVHLQWPALLPEHATRTVVARELVSWRDLADEGAAMTHCVAGYARSCAAGTTRVFSLKLADGKSRSTLELRRSPTGHWRVAQHRAVKNVRPHATLRRWEGTLVNAVNKAQAKVSSTAVSTLPIAA